MYPLSSKTTRLPEPRVVISFHDLHAGSLAVCECFLARMEQLGVDRVTLLVVPSWHGNHRIQDDSTLIQWLRDLSTTHHEICLHGYEHRAREKAHGGMLNRMMAEIYTDQEGEFFQLNALEAGRRLQQGLDMFHNAGLKTDGFIAPAWLLSPGARLALKLKGFRYTVLLGRLDLLNFGFSIPAPTLVYSTRAMWRRQVSRGWVHCWHAAHRNSSLIRLAVHPDDLQYDHIEKSIYALAESLLLRRTATTYREIVDAATHASLPQLKSQGQCPSALDNLHACDGMSSRAAT